ncbi:MAG: hypothetical protein JW995_03400 [Melioribacteraceae bacterium]|nr:hypothetical protein [Melioribacteraceae bacterium]
MNYNIMVNEKSFKLEMQSGNSYKIDEIVHNTNVTKSTDNNYILNNSEGVTEVTHVKSINNEFVFLIEGEYYFVKIRSKLEELSENILANVYEQSGIKEIKSPMPGMILKIEKKIGEIVEKGDYLYILEAMKMENRIKSHVSGTVTKIMKKTGESIEKNEILMVIE